MLKSPSGFRNPKREIGNGARDPLVDRARGEATAVAA